MLALSLGASLLTAVAASAQTAPNPAASAPAAQDNVAVEEVVVTGFRASLTRSTPSGSPTTSSTSSRPTTWPASRTRTWLTDPAHPGRLDHP
ncbi:hypothetical protein ACRAWD_03145 [Caulobacter segnis]